MRLFAQYCTNALKRQNQVKGSYEINIVWPKPFNGYLVDWIKKGTTPPGGY